MQDDDVFVDDEMSGDPELNQITNAIIGAAIAVHKELGAGHAESIYENALAIEFRYRGIEFVRQMPVQVNYRGEPVGATRIDFVASGKVIVELKAIETLAPIHASQCISYLKATRLRLALLINFNVRKLKEGIKRIAN